MSAIKITVCTWYDTVTPDSASEGDYASTGNDWREYQCATLKDAVDTFVDKYHDNQWENIAEINDVLYASDPEIDYQTGEETHYRLVLNVSSDDTIICDREKRIKRALSYLINKAIP